MVCVVSSDAVRTCFWERTKVSLLLAVFKNRVPSVLFPSFRGTATWPKITPLTFTPWSCLAWRSWDAATDRTHPNTGTPLPSSLLSCRRYDGWSMFIWRGAYFSTVLSVPCHYIMKRAPFPTEKWFCCTYLFGCPWHFSLSLWLFTFVVWWGPVWSLWQQCCGAGSHGEELWGTIDQKVTFYPWVQTNRESHFMKRTGPYTLLLLLLQYTLYNICLLINFFLSPICGPCRAIQAAPIIWLTSIIFSMQSSLT